MTCDHVGAARYTSADKQTQICYRCGNDIEQPEVMDTSYDGRPGFSERPVPDANTAGKVGREHPDTAQQAATRIMPRTGTQRQKVLTAIRVLAQTDEELQTRLTMNPSSQRPRRVELVEQRWIEDSGVRRKTSSGADAIVWRYKPEDGGT